MRRKLKVDSIFKLKKTLRLFTVYLVIFIMRCTGSPTVHKCYVCGPESEQPFIDESLNVSEQIQKSCENFDQLSEHAKQSFAIGCPRGYKGCITKIGHEVTRTCSGVFVNDCRTVNDEHVCICNGTLCNGEKLKNYDNLHTYNNNNEDDTEEDSDENDQESGDDDNYESFIRTSTIESTMIHATSFDHNKIDDDITTEKFNEFVTVTVPTMPSINMAVNFNLNQLLLINISAIIFAIAYIYSPAFIHVN